MSTELTQRVVKSTTVRRSARASLARDCPYAFAEFVGRDEDTGKPIRLVECHDDMIRTAENYRRFIILASPELGKSVILTFLYTLWLIGRNYNTFRGVIASRLKRPNATKYVRTIRDTIDTSKEFQMVFPEVRKGPEWSTEGIIVARDDSNVRDMTLAAVGNKAKMTGPRLNWFFGDDVTDWETARSEYLTNEQLAWVNGPVTGRMLRDGKIGFACNAWEQTDAMHKLASDYGYKLVRIPVRSPKTGLTVFPLRWPQERFDEVHPALQSRILDCIAGDRKDSSFKEEWIRKCKLAGAGLRLVDRIEDIPEWQPKRDEKGNVIKGKDGRPVGSLPKGWFITAGVDLGTSPKKTSDDTCIFVVLVRPSEEVPGDPFQAIIRPLKLVVGKWAGPDIEAQLQAVYDDFGAHFMVEDNAAQVFLHQYLGRRRPDIGIEPFRTDEMKWHPWYGVQGIAMDFAAGLWEIPCVEVEPGVFVCEPEIEQWLSEARAFDHNEKRKHTGDRLMASWFTREGARDRFWHRLSDDFIEPEAAPPESAEEREKQMYASQAEDLWDELSVRFNV